MDYRNNNNIDNIIRGALEDTVVPFDSQHWSQIEEQLDAINLGSTDTPEDIAFDAATAASLFELESSSPADWTSFENTLERAEEENPFDAVISASLAGATTTATIPDWDAFNDILSRAEATDLVADNNIVDETAKQKLDYYEAPYNPDNWAIMRERLAEEFSIRRKLIRYKVAEISLMLLAVFTLFNYLPTNELGHFKIIKKVEKLIKKTKTNKKVVLQEAVIIASSTSNDFSNDLEVIKFKVLPTEKRTNYIAVENPVYVIAPAQISSIKPLPLKDQSVQQNNQNLDLDLELSSTPIVMDEEKKGLFRWMNKEKKEEIEERAFTTILTGLATTLSNEVKSSKEEKALKPSKAKIEHKAVRLGMFTSADLYGVYSPYDRFFNYRPDAVFSSNFGGGIMIDFQKDRTHIQVGGAYMPKYFTPDLGDQVYGSFFTAYVSEEFEKIQLNVLHIPFELRYDFIQKPKWRVYGAGGVSANLVLNTAYQIKEDISVNSRATPLDIEMEQDEKSNLVNKTFTQGAAEGGNLEENLFLSVQLGLGVERFITQRWSIFFEPNYQQQFSKNGIGPNENSFRTMSLRLGAKATMFGK